MFSHSPLSPVDSAMYDSKVTVFVVSPIVVKLLIFQTRLLERMEILKQEGPLGRGPVPFIAFT